MKPAVFFLAALGLAAGGRAAAPAAGAGLVVLPAFVVTDTRILPPPEAWDYAAVPGFEILSSTGRGSAARAVDDFLRFHRAVEAIWPLERLNAAVPATLILCGRARAFARLVPPGLQAEAGATLSVSYQDKEMAAIVVACDAAAGDAAAGSPDFAQNILHQEFANFVLTRLGERVPPWLRVGLGRILATLEYPGDQIVVPAWGDDPNLAARAAGRDEARGVALRDGSFAALVPLFAGTTEAVDPDSPLDTPNQREAYEFTHFCLFGQQGRYRAAFWEFAQRAAREPVSAETLRRCFGTDELTLERAFWAYTDFSRALAFAIQGAHGGAPASVPTLVWRAAADAEVGRIVGEAQRLAGRPADAHLSLIAPYIRGSRDPQLLASLGLEEAAAGHGDRARQFLAAAVSQDTRRARAYVELARLRLRFALAHPLAPAGRLAAAQLADVFASLFQGRTVPPALPDTYALIAETWTHAGVPPKPAHLAVIDEGVARFPYDGELVCADVRLHAQYGFTEDAAALCAFGLRFATEPGERARLVRLQKSLGERPDNASAPPR